ncbi:hypothetical protein CONCODRAFT_3894 [Conidiobolus coronatus NRRL 28638]|uniref:Uncharacterized protein n=1 Tax=Conidiobolus coronatus (strain ATCC 28846 / CBS 209.66 / NRRL 28638) TaxID=796925 RepID=A0A137PDY4_CONC2|nr:hypothetical protein CONCODRAFT_3894 [Conidiobolus coronatus NRRL 28638]|eukprot:KXN73223.1 hypothetical protein CONCODRAFT_3894 [Conidiobolus coronatus NRRL 28638]
MRWDQYIGIERRNEFTAAGFPMVDIPLGCPYLASWPPIPKLILLNPPDAAQSPIVYSKQYLLPQSKIQHLKEKITAEFWRAIASIRLHPPNSTSSLIRPTNIRSFESPPIPPNSFGNFVMTRHTSLSALVLINLYLIPLSPRYASNYKYFAELPSDTACTMNFYSYATTDVFINSWKRFTTLANFDFGFEPNSFVLLPPASYSVIILLPTLPPEPPGVIAHVRLPPDQLKELPNDQGTFSEILSKNRISGNYRGRIDHFLKKRSRIIPSNPLFPGFYKAVVIKDAQVIVAIKELNNSKVTNKFDKFEKYEKSDALQSIIVTSILESFGLVLGTSHSFEAEKNIPRSNSSTKESTRKTRFPIRPENKLQSEERQLGIERSRDIRPLIVLSLHRYLRLDFFVVLGRPSFRVARRKRVGARVSV